MGLGYRILYDNDSMQIDNVAKKKAGGSILSVLLVCMLLIGGLKMIGWQRVKYYLLPGDPDITENAFSSMVENIRAGESVKDAVTAFCVEIIDNAK